MDYKVSVIITTFNRDYNVVKRCIESVFKQTYTNYELIVINDTPNDFPKFKEVSDSIMEYEGQLMYVPNGINQGACFVRNQGFELSRGAFIAFLDDDDEWYENKLEEQMNVIIKEKCAMVTCAFKSEYTDDAGKVYRTKVVNNKKYEITLQDILLKNVVGGCSAPIISREAFMKSGGFNNDMPSAQDYDLWIKIALLGKIHCVLKPLFSYYIHKSERISGNPEKKVYAYKYLIEMYSKLAETPKKFLTNKYLIISYNYYLLNMKDEGDLYYNLENNQKTITKTAFLYQIKITLLKIKNSLVLRQFLNYTK